MVTRLIKTRSLIFMLFLSLISTMGCTNNQLKPELPNLTFQASLQENLGGEFLISLEYVILDWGCSKAMMISTE